MIQAASPKNDTAISRSLSSGTRERNCQISTTRWIQRAIAAGHSVDDEPFLQLRDDRKLKKDSDKGLGG